MVANSKRRSQLVIPFGVGAIVDFKDETWMSAGINFWPSEISPRDRDEIINATQIIDRRLQERMTVLLKRTNNPIKFFLQPTIKSSRTFGASAAERFKMPFVRFPRWHFCVKCKKMHNISLTRINLGKCDSVVKGRKCNGMLSPIRFLIACEHGHISDFPWQNWVHKGATRDPANCKELYFTTSARPGLDGIIIRCSCGAKRSMAGAIGDPDALRNALPNGSCPGEKPWLLNEEENDNCLEVPITVQRGSSNTYFANSVSSILVPPYSKRVRQIIDSPLISKKITSIFKEEKVSEVDGVSQYDENNIRRRLRDIKDISPKLTNIPDDILFETSKIKQQEDLEELNNSASVSESEYRKKEFDAFLGSRPDELDRTDFDILSQDLSEYESWISKYFKSIVLVTNLRETRVLTGFSRIKPTSSGSERVSIYKSNNVPEWLPALEIRGEGIFLQFSKGSLDKWKTSNGDQLIHRISSREEWLKDVLDNDKPNYTRSEFISSELILIHTFSHLLIRQLIFNSGYSSSSLRERLYVSNDVNTDMYGLLIYTASGDAEGTLGGLVSMGRPGNFEKTLKQALDSKICSNDPICIETAKQGIQGINGAACHSCSLLPETSCEHSNTLLDRVLLFGSEDNSLTGYFSENE